MNVIPIPSELAPEMRAVIENHRGVYGTADELYAALLAAMPRPAIDPVAWMTHHEPPMIFLSEKEAAAYCDDESPIPLYEHPTAGRRWQRIETAPRDGTEILVCTAHPRMYSPCMAVWAEFHPNSKGRETWRTSRIGGNKLAPTHWMPLPAAPGEVDP